VKIRSARAAEAVRAPCYDIIARRGTMHTHR
ncbi:uncharacterized protein METZ01_LOCUS329797, partial [marine metagenome]